MKIFLKNLGIILYFIIGQCIGTSIVFIYTSYNNPNWYDKIIDCLSVETINMTEYLGLISKILIPCLIIANLLILFPLLILLYRNKRQYIKPLSIIDIRHYLLLGILINMIISLIVHLLPQKTTGFYNQIMNIAINGNFIIIFIASGILAPIMEELLFRYALIEINRKKSNLFAIIISSLCFGIAHMNIIQGTYAFLIGLLLSYIYIKTQNIIIPILIHFSINSSSIIYEFLPTSQSKILILCISSIYIIYEIIYSYKNSNSLKGRLLWT